MSLDKRRYATRSSQKRDVSFQAYISKAENEALQKAMEYISKRDRHKYSKGEFMMWMFSEIFGDRDFMLSKLNDFENDTAEIRNVIATLENLLSRREKLTEEIRDYNEEDAEDE